MADYDSEIEWSSISLDRSESSDGDSCYLEIPADHRSQNQHSREHPTLSPISNAAASEGGAFTPSTEPRPSPLLGSATGKTTIPWLPYTLRWQYLWSIIALACVLETAVVVLHVVSVRNHGLVDDDGSSWIVFYSKFLPTTLAVIYILLLSILLDDVKRTESFARLASPSGATAGASLTWTADAWWDALFGSFPEKPSKTSWPLLLSTVTFILGFLVVSPLSSSLVVSETITVASPTHFSRLDVSPSMPVQTAPMSTTYFRTIINILRNTTTSAWIEGNFVVLPLWPATTERPPLGPILSSAMESWTAESIVFSTELVCQNLEVDEFATIGRSPMLVHGPSSEISVTLSSTSGCIVNLRSDYFSSLATYGGIVWLARSNRTALLEEKWSIGRILFNTSRCADDNILVATSPLSDGRSTRLENATITAQACRTRYYMGQTTITTSLRGGRTRISFNERQYNSTRKITNMRVFDSTAFEEVFFGLNWTVHIEAEVFSRSSAFGPGNLLSAIYDWSPDRAAADNEIAVNMQKIQQRFFAELLQDTFALNANQNLPSILGSLDVTVRRLLTVSAVAIILEVVIAVQVGLLMVVFISTRIATRPLGLAEDPTPALSLARLLAEDEGSILSTITPSYDKSSQEIKFNLSRKHFQLLDGNIRLQSDHHDANTASTTQNSESSARPTRLFKSWVLMLLLSLVCIILVAIAILYWYAQARGLHQTAFIYTAHISFGGTDLGLVSPASILTTLIAVVLGLWWGSFETLLRKVQPYLALAQRPVEGFKGVAVSYRSSYLLWAALRGARRSHWILASVCTGAFMTEILTVAMSSLWTRGPGTPKSSYEALRKLELRHVPFVTRVIDVSGHSVRYSKGLITGVADYSIRTSFIYGATVQLYMGGLPPSWSSQEWSFVPIDLSSVAEQDYQVLGSSTTMPQTQRSLTLETQAIRARLECVPYEFPTDTSGWLTEHSFSNGTFWNLTASPNILSLGYELGLATSSFSQLPLPRVVNGTPNFFGDSTSFYVDHERLVCCENITNGQVGTGSVGYWSWNYPRRDESQWPINFTVKWIHGYPVQNYQTVADGTSYDDYHLIWAEKPQMTALNCMPMIEIANASVIVDADDAQVLNFSMLEVPHRDDFAWSDNSIQHHNYAVSNDSESKSIINVTDSYGVIFVQSLLCGANLGSAVGFGFCSGPIPGDVLVEDIGDQNFNIRNPGLNVDLMTFSMLSLAKNNHSALLDPEILRDTASLTFATIFQHFISGNRSLDSYNGHAQHGGHLDR